MYQLAVSRLFAINAKNTDEQLGNVKEIHQMIWQIITDFLKLLSDKEKEKEKYIILFISYYLLYSLGVFFQAKDTKAGAIECCQTWMSLTLSVTKCMSSWDMYIYVSLKQPIGVAPPGFQPGLAAWKNSLSSIPPTFPFTVCKPWLSARGMVLVALTAKYQECLKAGPFDVHFQCISAWLHCDCSTRMRCVDTVCWHLSLIYLYREDALNVPVT